MIETQALAKAMYEDEKMDKWLNADLDVREAYILRAIRIIANYDRIFYGA